MMEYTEYSEYKTSMLLWKYVPPVILLVGLVGNISVLVVLSKTSMRLTTTSLYLRFLAVTDMIVLYTNFLRHYIKYVTGYNIRYSHPVVCKLITWITRSTEFISVWLLVAVTLERLFSVCAPHKVKVICTKRNTYIIIVVIIVFMSLLNSHFLVGLGDYVETVGNVTEVYHCDSDIVYGYYDFEKYYWPWAAMSVFTFIPSFILIVCNACIIYKVVASSRRALQNDSSTIQHRHVLSRQSQATSLTAMLVVTSATFIITMTPYAIYLLYYSVFWKSYDNPREKAIDKLLWTLSTMFYFTNNCINFIVYCVSGRQFRQELRGLLCGVKRHRPQLFTTSLSTRRSQTNSSSTSTSELN